MYNAPPPNLMHGIQLVESGRKAEALAYLRHAARTEPIPADGWLWLAAASDDREEYRHCVNQALLMDAAHPVARRMREALDRQDRQVQLAAQAAAQPDSGYYQLPYPSYTVPEEDTMLPHRPSRLRRVLRAVVMVGIVGGCIGGMAWLAASGVVEDAARDWLKIEETHKLSFTVSEQPGFRFSVEVPDSWMPANVDSDSWRDTRDALMAAFPVADGEVSVWEQVETSFSAAVRDPVYGVVRPQVRIVETDRDRLSDSGVVAALTLHEIVPLPAAVEGQPSDACGRLRALEQQFNANGALTSTPTNEVIDSALATRGKSGDCVFYVQRRRTEQAAHEVILPISLSRAPSATQDVMLAVPVGAERYAVWHLTFADSAAGDYQSVVERVIGSLVYVPQD